MFNYENEEQGEIRRSIQKLAKEQIPRFQNDKFYGTVPRDLFAAFAGLGLTGMSVAETSGGIEVDPVTFALTIEEIAAVDLGAAIFLSVHNMVAGILNRSASAAVKEKWLTKLAAGELLGAFALTEPAAGSDAAAIRCQAVKKDDTYYLSGEKCYITSAGFADLYVVFARTTPGESRDGISCFVVFADDKGLTISPPEKKMGAELSPIASLTFDSVPLPSERLIGDEGNGYRIALSGLAGGRISIASCACGIARSALERAIKHLEERKQFGRALQEFQGLQFMVADMYMQLEAARLLTWQAAHVLQQDPASRDNRLHPSVAKCFATDAAMKITTDAVQLLGGAGYIREYEVERLMRDAKMLQIVEGTNQIQRAVIARELFNKS